MGEGQLSKYRGMLFQLYSLSAVNVEERFKTKYGYGPEVIVVTGGGIFVGPVQEQRDDSERDDRPART